MNNSPRAGQVLWSSRWAFILAATGSAVGLGNIWKFPYMTGANGGAVFVLIYLVCIALVGVPIMMAEVMLGRRGARNPVGTMGDLAVAAGRSRNWRFLGFAGVLTGVLILSYYSVIAGCTLAFIAYSASGSFQGLSAGGAGEVFPQLVARPWELLAWHSLFMLMTTAVVSGGVRFGLERTVRVLMPALFVMLVVLVIYGWGTTGFESAVRFMFQPSFDNVTAGSVLAALGHAFFTLSLGMCAIMMYGAYLPSDVSIARTTLTIAAVDTGVAMLAGLAVFPVVFASGLSPARGPGLIFEVLPTALSRIPGGTIFATVFFVLLASAAWTSAISLLEPAVAWLTDGQRMGRRMASLCSGLVAWILGVGTILSFNVWTDVDVIHGQNLFETLEFLTTNIMLPVCGLLIVVFASWFFPRNASVEELAMGTGRAYGLWRFVARYITPVCVLVVFLAAIGLLGTGA
jgi:neurotransmitter:Na+ symporter, NSS family